MAPGVRPNSQGVFLWCFFSRLFQYFLLVIVLMQFEYSILRCSFFNYYLSSKVFSLFFFFLLSLWLVCVLSMEKFLAILTSSISSSPSCLFSLDISIMPMLYHLKQNISSFGWGFPGGSVGKESACKAGDAGDVSSVPGWGRAPVEGNDYPMTPIFLP